MPYGLKHDVMLREDGELCIARFDEQRRLPDALFLKDGRLRTLERGIEVDVGYMTEAAAHAIRCLQSVPVILFSEDGRILGGGVVPLYVVS